MKSGLRQQQEPTMYFIGVSTTKSSIMKVFPFWMAELGRQEVRIEGVDLKLHDDGAAYRHAVEQIKYDPLSLGALVTVHKISLFENARDLFDFIDPYAEVCGEVSSISKNGLRLEGHAKDPITAGISLDSMLGQNYFGRTGGEVLCLGAGGSTTAIMLHFARKPDAGDRPRRIVIVNRSINRLEKLRAMVAGLGTPIGVEYHCQTDPRENDRLMAELRPGSLVINATGMGKDLPGSPITNNGAFPVNGIAWELNYRGELEFLHQALARRKARGVLVEDGWVYFLHGWTQVIAQVLKLDIGAHAFDRLAEIAAKICVPALPPRDPRRQPEVLPA
ncbi:MAG: shikimate dehydrogenase family protein [Bryobacteraceae bacterium]